MLLHRLAPQAYAAAHIKHPLHGHAQIRKIRADKRTQPPRVLGIDHAGLLVKVKALVIRLVKPLVAC
jgi:DNA-directed RNA polymerase subunit L